jgi:hypothetical protein
MALSANAPVNETNSGQASLPSESTRFHFPSAAFALMIGLAAFFVYLSHRPLWHTDVWGHLAYGRLIVARGAIPSTEPLMPLGQGVPFIDFSWLSQVIGYGAYRWQGIAALQFLYAASVTLCVGLLAWCSLRKTGSFAAAALASGLYVWVDWQQLAIARPQLAGCVCFLLLFAFGSTRLVGSRLRGAGKNRLSRSFALQLLMLLLFAAWSNLHGSFLMGLAVLAAFTVGRAGDVLRRTGSFRAVAKDRRVRRGMIFLLLAVTGATLNPYGWRIYEAVWRFSSNANLADLVEWKPLALWMAQGRAALAVSIGLGGLYLLTPRRISVTELLLLVGLGTATLARSRMIVWWGPIAAYYASLHAAAVWKQWRRSGSVGWAKARFGPPAHRSGSSAGWASARLRRTWPTLQEALFGLVAVSVAIACTPLAADLVRGKNVDRHLSLSAQTPIDATDFLCGHPPRGQVFNTLEWGDYLLWAGPQGLEVFVASHVHLVPRRVWQDYLRVITLEPGWQEILERYRVNTAILDIDQHAALADALREDPAWSIVYDDEGALIVVRQHPLSGERKQALNRYRPSEFAYRLGAIEFGPWWKKSSGPLHV